MSNEIIRRCSSEINLDKIFDGYVHSSMKTLNECIECCIAWKEIYNKVGVPHAPMTFIFESFCKEIFYFKHNSHLLSSSLILCICLYFFVCMCVFVCMLTHVQTHLKCLYMLPLLKTDCEDTSQIFTSWLGVGSELNLCPN